MTQPVRRRGQPAIALVALLVGWIIVRAGILGYTLQAPETTPKLLPTAAPVSLADRAASAPTLIAPAANASDFPQIGESLVPVPQFHANGGLPGAAMVDHRRDRIRSGAGMQLPSGPAMPLSDEAIASPLAQLVPAASNPVTERLATPVSVSAPPTRKHSRWSGDSWLLLRQDGRDVAVGSFAGPSYGASQAGAVLRYRLGSATGIDVQAYLRGSTALSHPDERELAIGLALRPLRRLPATIMVEGRETRSGRRMRLRPAVAIVTALPPMRLPLGLRAETYAQAGYVGGAAATGFIDGQARIDHGVASVSRTQLRIGGGIWGGAQRGAARLDAGPSVTLAFPAGEATVRLAADWRFRLAGQATPSSGPALTLSAGF
jgi:hypothetical protein